MYLWICARICEIFKKIFICICTRSCVHTSVRAWTNHVIQNPRYVWLNTLLAERFGDTQTHSLSLTHTHTRAHTHTEQDICGAKYTTCWAPWWPHDEGTCACVDTYINYSFSYSCIMFHMRMQIHMYTHLNTYICNTHTHIHTYDLSIRPKLEVHASAHTCTHSRKQARAHTLTNMRTLKHARTHVCTHARAHTHTSTHSEVRAHAHTHILSLSPSLTFLAEFLEIRTREITW